MESMDSAQGTIAHEHECILESTNSPLCCCKGNPKKLVDLHSTRSRQFGPPHCSRRGSDNRSAVARSESRLTDTARYCSVWRCCVNVQRSIVNGIWLHRVFGRHRRRGKDPHRDCGARARRSFMCHGSLTVPLEVLSERCVMCEGSEQGDGHHAAWWSGRGRFWIDV